MPKFITVDFPGDFDQDLVDRFFEVGNFLIIRFPAEWGVCLNGSLKTSWTSSGVIVSCTLYSSDLTRYAKEHHGCSKTYLVNLMSLLSCHEAVVQRAISRYI